MTELDMFLARTQRQLAFFLLIVLVLLVLAVLAVLLIPKIQVNQTATNLLVQVVTGVLALAGTACGFFYARMRPGGIPDAQVITQSHTAPDGSKTTISTPVAVAAAMPTLATTAAVTAPLDKQPEKPV